jgi:hypothetical protein
VGGMGTALEARRASLLPGLAVAVLVLLMSGLVYLPLADDPDTTAIAALGLDDSDDVDDIAGQPAADATREAIESATSVPPPPEDLSGVFLTDVPAGFELIPDTVGDTGPLDLAAAAGGEEDPESARKVLEASGFARGHTRSVGLRTGPQPQLGRR